MEGDGAGWREAGRGVGGREGGGWGGGAGRVGGVGGGGRVYFFAGRWARSKSEAGRSGAVGVR